MSDEDRKNILDKLTAEDSDNPKSIPYRRSSLIWTLSQVIAEEMDLQADVNANGGFYETQGDKGQRMVKKRPQYEELGRLRDRKLRISKELGLDLEAVGWSDF